MTGLKVVCHVTENGQLLASRPHGRARTVAAAHRGAERVGGKGTVQAP